MRFSEAHQRQVVATSSATTLGRVEGFVVATDPPRVTALRLGGTHGGPSLVSYGDLKAFGQDAVTVEDERPLRLPADADEERMSAKDHDLLGKPALLETGEQVGLVSDVEFDPADGTLRAVVTSGPELPGPSLLGVGSYAVVFAAPD